MPAQAFLAPQATPQPPPPPPPQAPPGRMPLTLVSSRGSSAPPPLARHYPPAYNHQPPNLSASGSRLVYAPLKKDSKGDDAKNEMDGGAGETAGAPVLVAHALPKRFFANKGAQRPMLGATNSVPLRAMSPHAHPPFGKMYSAPMPPPPPHHQFSPNQSNSNQSPRG